MLSGHFQTGGVIAFVRSRRDNRLFFIAAIVAMVPGWVVFKLFFPYPTLIFDSYFYIRAAVLNQDVNAWPIGYSKFLQGYGLLSHSAWGLVTLQYLLFGLSGLYFFFTWSLLFRPSRWVRVLVFLWLFVNPIFYYCCNYIMADCLFVSLSLVWLTQLLWIIYRPRAYFVLTHAIVLLLAFTVRYNALYYPFVGAFAFLLSRQPVRVKIAGILLPLILIGSFVVYTRNRVAAISGQEQFSPFGGWKIANDALYAYGHVDPAAADAVPKEFAELDQLVRQYFARSHDPCDLLKPDQTSGSPFMFFFDMPLVQYMNMRYGPDGPAFNCPKWMAVAPLYQRYGSYLIRRYPVAFARYFMLPNLWRYIFPPSENYGTDVSFYFSDRLAGPFVKELLGLTTLHTKRPYIESSIWLLKQYRLLFLVFHCLFFLSMMGFFMSRRTKLPDVTVMKPLMLVLALWGADLAFSVFSAGIVLRYQLFTTVIEWGMGLWFIDLLSRRTKPT